LIQTLCLTLFLALAGLGCSRSHASEKAARSVASADAKPLEVPRLHGELQLDGALTEPGWHAAGRTGPFLDVIGKAAIPYSEARVTWDDERLYVGLYAADEDIEAHVTAHDAPVWTDDSFLVRISTGDNRRDVYAIDVSATGVISDARGTQRGFDPAWESGAAVAVDHDGTVNDPSDQDEEWVVEMSIPFASLGVTPVRGAKLGIEIARCDKPKHAPRRCGWFGKTPAGAAPAGVLVLAP
jgi:hypothetical protein